MARLVWDSTGKKNYEYGDDHAVVYPKTAGTYPKGYAWNGITAFTVSPDGAEAQDMWADNIKYATMYSTETLGGTIEAYQSPEEFDKCDGTISPAKGVLVGQQTRQPFGFSIRTMIGNDSDGQEAGYKLYLIYGATASPSEKSYETANDSPEGITLSWEFTTTPETVTTLTPDGKPYKPTSMIVLNSLLVDADKLSQLEDILYGKEGEGTGNDARLPLPDEVISMFSAAQG